MTTYIWKIESTDEQAGTMVVSFIFEDSPEVMLNVPMPTAGISAEDWIKNFVPAPMVVSNFEPVTVGATGSTVIDTSEGISSGPINELPNTTGSWNEEYLRAMIYQVLEEIKDAAV